MRSRLAHALNLKQSPVAIVLTDDKPAGASQFKEGKMGCVAAMLLAAARGKSGVFDRKTFGCPGGGTGLGFGNCYTGFPIDRLLSTGGQSVLADGSTFDMRDGERFHATPEVTDRWVQALPYRDVPTQYVVIKPLDRVNPQEAVSLILMLVTADQLSALVTLAGFRTGAVHTTISPWGAACQSILFAYAEAKKDLPHGVIGFFDISQRSRVDREILSFTVPYSMFLQMESDVEESFLGTTVWQKLRERQ
jgi:uncharacterized protein (DUF169 family)